MTRALRLALVAALAAAACRSEEVPVGRRVVPGAGEGIPVRASDLVAGEPGPWPTVRNPYEGNVHAIAEGKRLYSWMNCAGCHGAIGGGAIGPPLMDRDWIYGSEPENVYQSIVEGRPNGMPSYRGRLPDDALWKLVAFVRAMGGTDEPQEPGAVAAEPAESRAGSPQTDERKKLKEGKSGGE